MNSRIKQLRKRLNLTLEEFGSRIGITSSGLSKIERGLSGASDQTILSISREFNVNEEWLRTGNGDMFNQDEPSILARLSCEYKLTQREEAVIAAFLELSDADRAAIMRYVDGLVSKLSPPGGTPVQRGLFIVARAAGKVKYFVGTVDTSGRERVQ